MMNDTIVDVPDFRPTRKAEASAAPFDWPSDSDDKEKLLSADADKDPVRRSIFTFAFYQSFFDVETRQVIARILGSMTPMPSYLRNSYLDKCLRPNPDLYGPFWIATTLVFSIAISGNMANYMQYEGDPRSNYLWKYDFHKVSLAWTIVFSYCCLLPGLIYGYLWSKRLSAQLGLLDLVCLYGYSLAIFVPASIIWVINLHSLQWLAAIAAASASGYVLVSSLYTALKDDRRVALFFCSTAIVAHFLLAVLLVALFFSSTSVRTPSVSGGGVLTTLAPHGAINTTLHVPGTERLIQSNGEKTNDHTRRSAAALKMRPDTAPTPQSESKSNVANMSAPVSLPKLRSNAAPRNASKADLAHLVKAPRNETIERSGEPQRKSQYPMPQSMDSPPLA